jgi:hypothetical protein
MFGTLLREMKVGAENYKLVESAKSLRKAVTVKCKCPMATAQVRLGEGPSDDKNNLLRSLSPADDCEPEISKQFRSRLTG